LACRGTTGGGSGLAPSWLESQREFVWLIFKPCPPGPPLADHWPKVGSTLQRRCSIIHDMAGKSSTSPSRKFFFIFMRPWELAGN
jgi:hypothetical protein